MTYHYGLWCRSFSICGACVAQKLAHDWTWAPAKVVAIWLNTKCLNSFSIRQSVDPSIINQCKLANVTEHRRKSCHVWHCCDTSCDTMTQRRIGTYCKCKWFAQRVDESRAIYSIIIILFPIKILKSKLSFYLFYSAI